MKPYLLFILLLLSQATLAQFDSTRLLLKAGFDIEYAHINSGSNKDAEFRVQPTVGLSIVDKHANVNDFGLQYLGIQNQKMNYLVQDSNGVEHEEYHHYKSSGVGLSYAKLLMINKKSDSKIKYGVSLGMTFKYYYQRSLQKDFNKEEETQKSSSYILSIPAAPTLIWCLNSNTCLNLQTNFILYEYERGNATRLVNGKVIKGAFKAFPQPIPTLSLTLYVGIK